MSLKGNEQIRAFFEKLAATNVSNYVELPMIAVMGETSSGKSSLLSSVSGVELPSASELTTRCPIMLQMNRGEVRKAVVSVQWKDIPEGKSIQDIDFHSSVVTENSWQDLPDAIARAQKHIIAISGKNVARDIVHVKVDGPHCEDLTVVDLPGIVRTRGINEDESIIEDIKALIGEYLANSRCVILAVVPANVDFHNSQIMADALKVDPETKRTIPVITKPDLIDQGAEGDVMSLLLGQKTNKFEMGFHMVKGRGQTELNQNVTIDQGLKNEEAYFESNEPWKSVDNRTLFGTENLRKKLNKLEIALMQEQFPAIIDEIDGKYDLASSELEAIGDIPQTSSEKRMLYREVCEEVVSLILSLLKGRNQGSQVQKEKATEVETLPSKLHGECEVFQCSLRNTKFSNISSIQVGVDVLVSSGQEIVRGIVIGEKIGTFYVDYVGRDTTKRSDFIHTYNTSSDPDKTSESQGKTWTDADGSFCIARGGGKHDVLKAISEQRLRRDPSWILPWIKKNRTDELPIFVNTAVFDAIVTTFIDSEWAHPSHHLVKFAHKLLKNAVEEAIKKIEKLSQYPILRSLLLRKLKEKADLIAKIADERVAHLIKKEQSPYTQDHYVFENLGKKRSEPLLVQLKTALDLHSDPNSSMQKNSIKVIIDAVFNMNQRKTVDDHMAEDMQMALDSYVKVVLKRFIDGVPMECWNMLKEFPAAAKHALAMNVSDQELDHCLVADVDVERRQKELKAKVNELKSGLDALESLY